MRITFKGNGVVWDAARKKNLCKFKSIGYVEGVYQVGEFTTKDSTTAEGARTIELLKDYPTVPADAMKFYWEEKAKKEKKKSTPKKKTEVKKKAE